MTAAGVVRVLAIAVAAGVLAWLLDRALLAMEARGWIYWRRRRGGSGTLSSAFLSVQSLLEPEKRHVAERLRREEPEADEDGEPPRHGS